MLLVVGLLAGVAAAYIFSTTEINRLNRDLSASVAISIRDDGWAEGTDKIYHVDAVFVDAPVDSRGFQEVPSPTAANLMSVHMVDNRDGWAVGGETIINWNGSSWSVVDSPARYDLQSVFMVGPDDGWAVGEHATILHWNGSEWGVIETGFSPYKATSMFYSVFFVDSNDGWAVGDVGSIIHWTGEEWIRVASPVDSWLRSVFLVSSTDGWAVGHDRTIIHWNGSEWQEVESPIPYDLESVFMLSSTDGWGVGRAGVIVHWDGMEWRQIQSPLPEETGSNDLYSVFMLDRDDGWAVGPSWILHWDGTYWTKFPNPAERTLISVYMVASDDVWAVGYGGTIIHSLPELDIYLEAPDCLEPEASSLLNVTVYNIGLSNETVDLSLSIGGTVAHSETIRTLVSCTSHTFSYLWTPTMEAMYNVTAYALPVPGEINTGNNRVTRMIPVSEPDIIPPIAEAGIDQTVKVNAQVIFNASESTDNVGVIGYDWDFADGSTGTGMTTTHIYKQAGTYTVTLNVTDGAGNSATNTVTITVEEEGPPPGTIEFLTLIGTVMGLAILYAIRKWRSRGE